MEAVANPAHTSDLFFVADGTGGHAFADTLEQHQKNVRAGDRSRRTPRTGSRRTPPPAGRRAARRFAAPDKRMARLSRRADPTGLKFGALGAIDEPEASGGMAPGRDALGAGALLASKLAKLGASRKARGAARRRRRAVRGQDRRQVDRGSRRRREGVNDQPALRQAPARTTPPRRRRRCRPIRYRRPRSPTRSARDARYGRDAPAADELVADAPERRLQRRRIPARAAGVRRLRRHRASILCSTRPTI